MHILCPHCSNDLDASGLATGMLVSCPLCAAQFTIPPVPPPPPFNVEYALPMAPPKPRGNKQQSIAKGFGENLKNIIVTQAAPLSRYFTEQPQNIKNSHLDKEITLSSDNITVGQVIDFISDLPERPLVRKFSDGTNDSILLSRFKNELRSLPASSIYHTTTFQYPKALYKKCGWACLEFGCLFELCEKEIIKKEFHVSSDNNAIAVVKCLREIQAHTEVGISCNDFSHVIATRWLTVKDFVACKSHEYPLFASLVNGALTNYKNALDVWRRQPTQAPVSFIGGGFGVTGAITGMAIGMGLNAITGIATQMAHARVNQWISSEWSLASRKIAVASRVTTRNSSDHYSRNN